MIPGDKSYYPGTDVLINKFDIRDFAAARAAEYKFASVRELQLRVNPIQGKFDFAHLTEIHKYVFQDMYTWAGQLREVDFAKRSKETGLVSRFIPTIILDLKAEDFDKFITEKGQLKGLSKPEFVKAITDVQAKLNELHPFREGNGRSTRVFLTQLAREAGYDLDLTKIDKNRWNLANAQSMVQHDPKNEANKTIANQSELRQIFHESVKPMMAKMFMHEARAEAVKHYPELGQVYDRMEAIQRYANKLADPESGARLVEAEKARIMEKLNAGIIPPLNAYLQGRMSNQTTRQIAPAIALDTQAATEKKPARLRL